MVCFQGPLSARKNSEGQEKKNLKLAFCVNLECAEPKVVGLSRRQGCMQGWCDNELGNEEPDFPGAWALPRVPALTLRD